MHETATITKEEVNNLRSVGTQELEGAQEWVEIVEMQYALLMYKTVK